MPFSPDDLPWWGWLLCAAAALLLCLLLFLLHDGEEPLSYIGCCGPAFLLGVVAFLAGVVGIVQLVKWAWHG